MNALKITLVNSVLFLTACGGGISNLWATETPTPTVTPSATPTITPSPTPSATPTPTCVAPEGYIEVRPGEVVEFFMDDVQFAAIYWDGEAIQIQTVDEIQIFYPNHDGRYTIEVSVKDPEGGEVAMRQIPVWVCLGGNFYIDSSFLEKEEKNT